MYVEADSICSIDNIYYEILYNINNLFKHHKSIKFVSNIGNKSSVDSVGQNLVFYNKIDKTEKYMINIHNKYSITITIPIKKSNYCYTTILYDIEDVYYYLYNHLYRFT